MRCLRTRQSEMHREVGLVPTLEDAIDRWLAARADYKLERSERNEIEYNATYFALGSALRERYPEAADMPWAFDWYRRGLIAPGED